MIRMNLIVKDRMELKILVIKDTMNVMITVGIVVSRHDGKFKHVGKWYGWVY